MKSFACRDVGIDCDWKVTGKDDEEIVREAERHAREKHGMTEFSSDLRDKVRSNIKEVKAA